MKELTLKEGHILAPFFKDAYDSCPEAFIQGVMGRGFCDSLDNPTYGIIIIGDFCFLGGNGDGKSNILSILHGYLQNPDIILVPLSDSWDQQFYQKPNYIRKIRYAMDKPENSHFNIQKLTNYISRAAYDPDYIGEHVTRKFIIRPIDEKYYSDIRKENWSKDFTSNYATYADFRRNGLGYVVIEGSSGKIVAGASSFSSSLSSIEIEIATAPSYRKRGLATAISARMILGCIKRDIAPSWDAANLISVSIAEKLGYHFLEEYVCYILS